MLLKKSAQAGGMDSILLGLINDASAKYDTALANTLQNRLFEVSLNDGSVIAVDLAATNINRGILISFKSLILVFKYFLIFRLVKKGRDHGIPTYNDIRERCGLRKAVSFNDLSDSISADRIQLLTQVYE